MAYFVLAAGTDSSNTITRSGRQAIASALNCGRYAAAQAVTRMLEIGAIVSLEAGLANRRDPTAARFMLPLMGDISIGEDDMNRTVTAASFARLPNSLVQDKSQAANLHRAVRIGGMPVLTTLLQIATDPAQIIWPPEAYADIEMETLGRLGSKAVAHLDLTFGMTDCMRIRCAEAQRAILLLSEVGILCLDFYTAIPGHGSGDLTMFEPVATVWLGSVALNGPFGKVAILSLLAARILQHPESPLPEREALLAEFRLGAHMIALMPANMPNVHVVMRPRLAALPRDPETVEAERRLVSTGTAAARDILGVLAQNFPGIAADAKALVKAAPS
ncbi:MAG: hypothetical protein ACK4P4_00730 [Allorhizobium sp.]